MDFADVVLDQGHDKFGVFANNVDILGRLHHDRVVLVAALVEAHDRILVFVLANRELALGTVAFPLGVTLNELVHLEGLDIHI